MSLDTINLNKKIKQEQDNKKKEIKLWCKNFKRSGKINWVTRTSVKTDN